MKKKTAGILTFHTACNYGAVLQAYALKAVCEALGYETYIINYTNGVKTGKPAPIKEFMVAANKKKAFFRTCRKMLSYIGDTKRWSAFSEFRDHYLNESSACTTSEDVAALGYDVYISGSDQIWNYKITGNQFDSVYFGNFTDHARQIVYAASSQDTPFPLDMELKFKNMLMDTPAAIGIREQKLADYAAKLTGVRYPVVLDPVLLAGREIMEELSNKEVPRTPYILLYQIDANPASDISVKNLEKYFRCPVYTMTVPRFGSVHGRKGEVGPEDFLSLLKNAKFLVTNSFHGIALSLLFEKNFFVYENGGVMSRIDSLLAAVGLTDRKVKMVADIDPQHIINYRLVQDRLSVLREQSMTFLQDALDGKVLQIPVDAKTNEVSLPPMKQREKQDCCGCSACADICPVKAINMVTDEEGFLYPKINEETCIHCGKCDKMCGFRPGDQQEGFKLPRAFGIKHKDDAVRQSSRSGAAFVAFSDIILNQGGTVYGAAMAENFTVSHMRATTAAARDRMKTAKYVQSDVSGIYPQVAADLQEGKSVLFSGTPCQVAGLQEMLKRKNIDTTKLICCDLVCHGVPSPKVWKEYVEYIRRTCGGTILEANFRDKSFGWDSHCESFVIEGRKKKVVRRDYTDLFYDHIMFRPSCHNCPFANVHRLGDLTLADFWGIEKNDPSFDDNHGVSLVLAGSLKGIELLELAKPSLHWFECEITNCIQPTLVKPSTASPRRGEFWEDYHNMPFDQLLKKYTKPLTVKGKIKKAGKQILYCLRLRKNP